MELTTDVELRGTAWNSAFEAFAPLFDPRSPRLYNLYILSLAIGIMYDKRIEKPAEENEEPRTIARNVLRNHDNGKLDLMFQAAILSTTTEQLSEEERLDLAFGEKTEFKKMEFLSQFANYGVTELVGRIGGTPLETMENIKNFLVSTVEGRNLDIDTLPDEILLMDEM